MKKNKKTTAGKCRAFPEFRVAFSAPPFSEPYFPLFPYLVCVGLWWWKYVIFMYADSRRSAGYNVCKCLRCWTFYCFNFYQKRSVNNWQWTILGQEVSRTKIISHIVVISCTCEYTFTDLVLFRHEEKHSRNTRPVAYVCRCRRE